MLVYFTSLLIPCKATEFEAIWFAIEDFFC